MKIRALAVSTLIIGGLLIGVVASGPLVAGSTLLGASIPAPSNSTSSVKEVSHIPNGSVVGTISYDGAGVSNVCVSISSNDGGSSEGETATANDGFYTLTGLAADNYTLYVDPTCNQTFASTYAIQTLSPVDVTSGFVTTQNVSLALGGSIDGTLTYENIGVSGVCVSVNKIFGGFSSGYVSTISDGSYSFSGIPQASNYEIYVDPTCYGTQASPYAVMSVSPVTVTAGSTTTENVSLTLGGSISGIVTYNDVGVSGVCLDVDSSTGGQFVTTSSSGSYSVPGLESGKYDVYVDPTCAETLATPYAIQSFSSVTVGSGEVTTENVSLNLGGTITGTVTDNGAGVGNVCIFIEPSNGEPIDGGYLDNSVATANNGTFSYWGLPQDTYNISVDATCGGTVASPYAIVTISPVNVTAGSTIIENVTLSLQGSATIAFNSEGGTSVASVSGLEGTTITLPAAPTRPGYTFNGWFVASSGGTALSSPYTLSASTTLYAQWTANPTATIAFNSEGGTSVASVSGLEGTTITLPAAPTRPGYTFNGWFVASSGGTALSSPYTLSASTTLYAQWTLITVAVVIFNSEGGSLVLPVIGLTGTTIRLPTAPSFPGHVFQGWFLSASGGVALSSPYDITGTQSLYAHWKAN